MPLNERGFAVVRFADSPNVHESFAELPADPYCLNRFRRYSQYRVFSRDGRWYNDVLPHRPLVQPRKYNSYVGGVLRQLKPILFDVLPYLSGIADIIPLDINREWHFDVHQWRTVCHANSEAISVPEGPHQDGHEFGAIIVVSRHGIRDGITSLYSLTDRTLFFETTLAESEVLLFDDRRMLHFTSNIQTDNESGYRDIFVLNINLWENRKYGSDFELKSLDRSLSQASVHDLAEVGACRVHQSPTGDCP